MNAGDPPTQIGFSIFDLVIVYEECFFLHIRFLTFKISHGR